MKLHLNKGFFSTWRSWQKWRKLSKNRKITFLFEISIWNIIQYTYFINIYMQVPYMYLIVKSFFCGKHTKYFCISLVFDARGPHYTQQKDIMDNNVFIPGIKHTIKEFGNSVFNLLVYWVPKPREGKKSMKGVHFLIRFIPLREHQTRANITNVASYIKGIIQHSQLILLKGNTFFFDFCLLIFLILKIEFFN